MKATLHTVEEGGVFGYRFSLPRHARRPARSLLAAAAGRLAGQAGEPAVLPDAPLGYLTAYAEENRRPDRAVELWPRLLRRDLPSCGRRNAATRTDAPRASASPAASASCSTPGNCAAKSRCRGRSPAVLLTCAKHETLDDWLERCPLAAGGGEAGERHGRREGASRTGGRRCRAGAAAARRIR